MGKVSNSGEQPVSDSTLTDKLLAEIEELKRENLQLKNQPPLVRGQLEAIMDHSPATAWIKNSEGALLYINATFQKFIDDGEFPEKEVLLGILWVEVEFSTVEQN